MDDPIKTPSLKPLEWIGSARADLAAFPELVRKEMGHALHLAQAGEKPISAKPLRGFGGAGVFEIVENHAGNAYRAVYTVRFAKAIYVLHAFQKKSHKGVATPKAEIDLIKQRFKAAEDRYNQVYGNS